MGGESAERKHQLTSQNSFTTAVKDRRDNQSNHFIQQPQSQQESFYKKIDSLNNQTAEKQNDILGISQTYNSSGVDLKHLLNPVQKRYEDSKDSF